MIISAPVLKAKMIGVNRAMNTAGGDVAYTGAGFKPRVLIFMGAVTAAAGGLSHGFATSNPATKASLRQSPATTIPDGTTSFFIICEDPTDSSKTQTAIVKSFDSDGFTLTWVRNNAPAADVMEGYVLCLA